MGETVLEHRAKGDQASAPYCRHRIVFIECGEQSKQCAHRLGLMLDVRAALLHDALVEGEVVRIGLRKRVTPQRDARGVNIRARREMAQHGPGVFESRAYE